MQLTPIRLVKQQQCSFIPKYTYIVMGEVLKMKVMVTKTMTCSWLHNISSPQLLHISNKSYNDNNDSSSIFNNYIHTYTYIYL